MEQRDRRRRGQGVTLIQQRFQSDCAVAALAMFLEVPYEDIARHCQGYELVQSGLSWVREDYILRLFKTPCDVFDFRVMDWSEPAILSVPSLNEPNGVSHSIYWDGDRAWDPQQGREGKAAYTNQMARELAVTGIQRADDEIFPNPIPDPDEKRLRNDD